MNLDMGVSLLGKYDQNLQKRSLKPSEYFQRQIRVAPLHTDNTGWFLRNVGKDILMFNTDYPHPEGGKDPFGAYERSLDAVNASPKSWTISTARTLRIISGFKQLRATEDVEVTVILPIGRSESAGSRRK